MRFPFRSRCGFPVALTLALCASLAGCGDDDGVTDASTVTDSGVDSGSDAGGGDAGTDAGQPDAGPQCTEGCAFVDVALGFLTSCARRENGEVWCWGHNRNGEVGDGQEQHVDGRCTRETDLETQDCPGPKQVIDIGAATALSYKGSRTSCVIDEDESVWCWGIETIAPTEGDARERRFEPETIPGLAGATDVSVAAGHMCGVVAGEVLCFGFNEGGQLGNGDRTERRDPASPTTVTGLTGMTDVEVSSLDGRGGIDPFSCAHDGTTLYCWGSNQSGQLGDGASHEQCRDQEGTPYDCSPLPVEVDLPETITAITDVTLGARHACLVDQAGAVFCWGENAVGQLGTGDTEASETPKALPDLTAGVAQVTAGFRHTCARLESGGLRCWGGNEDGPLGDGTFDHMVTCSTQGDIVDCQSSPVTVVGIEDAVDVAAGYEHTCAARMSGEVWCWGWNDRRGLGDGTIERRAAPVQVQGLPL